MQLINYPLCNHEHYGLAINVSFAYILIDLCFLLERWKVSNCPVVYTESLAPALCYGHANDITAFMCIVHTCFLFVYKSKHYIITQILLSGGHKKLLFRMQVLEN